MASRKQKSKSPPRLKSKAIPKTPQVPDDAPQVIAENVGRNRPEQRSGLTVAQYLVPVAIPAITALMLWQQNQLIQKQYDYLVGEAQKSEYRDKVRSLARAADSLLEAQIEYMICRSGPKSRHRQYVTQMGTKTNWETSCESMLLEFPKAALTDPDFAMYFPSNHSMVTNAWGSYLDHKNGERLNSEYQQAMAQIMLDKASFEKSHGWTRIVMATTAQPDAATASATEANSSSSKLP